VVQETICVDTPIFLKV